MSKQIMKEVQEQFVFLELGKKRVHFTNWNLRWPEFFCTHPFIKQIVQIDYHYGQQNGRITF